MKKVGEIRASGFIFKVYHITDKEARAQTKRDQSTEDGYWGALIWEGKNCPRIDLNQCRQGRLREESMCHELMHLANDLGVIGLKEKQVKRLAYVFFGILKENFFINLNKLRHKEKK